ncbi:hypothetical protein KAU11_06295, partial [Candidatus Babeliales bacterium]|nr:hypothetical protein [Candidatus Babeliales bacterium]
MPSTGTPLTQQELGNIKGAGTSAFGGDVDGALYKTRTYIRGVLSNETTYAGANGSEYQTADIRYYDTSMAVRNTTISTVTDGVQTEQLKYFRDTFDPESETKFEEKGPILYQWRGKEIPTKITTYYDDGDIESVTDFTYDGAAGGIARTDRTVNDRIPGGITQTMTIDSVYTPEEPGRGRIESSETRVAGELFSGESYTYSAPEGVDSALEGLFVKERMQKKTSTTYHLDGGTSGGETWYSGLRGYEKMYKMEGTSPGIADAYKYQTVYDHDLVMRSLAMTGTSGLPGDKKRTSWYSGLEGEEKVVVIREYEDEDLSSVSRFYYTVDNRLDRKITDVYSLYGDYLYDKKPVTRTLYQFRGEPGHERIIWSVDDRGIYHYYRYFIDSTLGLVTAIVTNPEYFSDLEKIDAQVLSSDLVNEIFSNRNYIQTAEGTAVFTDRDGNTVMTVDRYGGLSKYEYKTGSNGIERDPDNGNPVETTIYHPDGSYMKRNSDGITVEEERLNAKGELTSVTHEYSDGLTANGVSAMETRTWTDYQWVP